MNVYRLTTVILLGFYFLLLYHCIDRTNGIAVTAVKTVLLLDHIWDAVGYDTVLRTDVQTA